MRIVKASAEMKMSEFEYDHVEVPYTVSKFLKMDTVKYNDPIQREAGVWDLDRKSLLIHTMLDNLPMPSLWAEIISKSGKRYRNILDGKQRGTTIREFHKNKFPLSEKTPFIVGFVTDENGEEEAVLIDVRGLTFNELPEILQEKFLSYTLRIVELVDLTEEKKREIFIRLNNGKQLNAQQGLKAHMGWDFLSYLNDLKNKNLFTSCVSERQNINDENAKLALQCLRILHTDGDTALSSAVLKQFVENKENENQELQQVMNSAVDYVQKSLALIEEDQQKSLLNQSRVQALIAASREAIKHNIEHEEFAKWVVFFLVDDYKNHQFASNASRNTTKRDNVRARIRIALDHFRLHCLKTAQNAS